MTALSLLVEASRRVIAKPDGSERGRLSVDMLAAWAKARDAKGDVCFLRPSPLVSEPLYALESEEVASDEARGIVRAWAESRWRLAAWGEAARSRRADAAASFWLECYRELRRQAANERLPIDLRGQLRDAAHRSFTRAQRGGCAPRFPRELLRHPMAARLPDSLLSAARSAAAENGVDASRPFVAVDLRARPDTMTASYQRLATEGFAIVALGRSPLVDVFVLLSCAFLICDDSDVQRMAYITNTPTLTINATDAYAFYPIRATGVYLLKTGIDLDTGRALSTTELLGEAYYKNQRNCGFRSNTSDEIASATAEMIDGVRRGWADSPAQALFRQRAVEQGSAIAPRVRHVAKWGPVDAFIGDGRLARIQTDREL